MVPFDFLFNANHLSDLVKICTRFILPLGLFLHKILELWLQPFWSCRIFKLKIKPSTSFKRLGF